MNKLLIFAIILFLFNFTFVFSQDFASLEFLSGKDYITFHSFGKTQQKQVFINTTNELYGVSIQCTQNSVFEELNYTSFSTGYVVELEDFCSEYNLIVDVKVNNSIKRIERRIKVIESKFSSQDILDFQKWDYSFGNEIQTAYAISSLIDFNKKTGSYSEIILNAIEWLKSRRNNEGKCWPKDDCSLLQSFQIATFLKFANFNDFLIEYSLPESKLLTDIELWANSMNNYLKDDFLKLEISSDSQTNCTVETLDRSNVDNPSTTSNEVSFQTDYEEDFTISRGRISISCNNRVDVILYNKNDKIVQYGFDERDFSYEFHNGCWSENDKWGSCSEKATIFGYYVANNEEILTQAKEFLDSRILTDQFYGNYLGNLENSILYLLFVENDEEIMKWVNYNQNNDGSWGSTQNEKYFLTPLALLAMYSEYGFEKEAIISALYWLSLNYDDLLEKNNLIYLSLFNKALYELAIPTLKYEPELIVSNNLNTSFNLINPSYFDMDLNFELPFFIDDSNFVKNKVISGYDSKNISLTFYDDLIIKEYFGFVDILTDNNFNFRIPVFLNQSPHIKFNVKDFMVSNSVFDVDVTATYTKSDFECNFSSDNIENSKQDFSSEKKSRSFDLDAELFNIGNSLTQKTITINYSCIDSYGYNEKGNFSFDVEYFPKNSFSVYPTQINYSSKEDMRNIVVKNEINNYQKINLMFKINDPYLTLYENEINLAPNENKSINILSSFPPDDIFEWSNVLEVKNKVESKDIAISVYIEKKKSPMMKFAFFILMISLGFVGYYYRKKIIDFFKKKDFKNLNFKTMFSKDKKEEVFNPDSEKEIIENLVNMLNLMQDFNKGKMAAVNELKNQGFKEEEINYALEKSNYNKKKETNQGQQKQE